MSEALCLFAYKSSLLKDYCVTDPLLGARDWDTKSFRFQGAHAGVWGHRQGEEHLLLQ